MGASLSVPRDGAAGEAEHPATAEKAPDGRQLHQRLRTQLPHEVDPTGGITALLARSRAALPRLGPATSLALAAAVARHLEWARRGILAAAAAPAGAPLDPGPASTAAAVGGFLASLLAAGWDPAGRRERTVRALADVHDHAAGCVLPRLGTGDERAVGALVARQPVGADAAPLLARACATVLCAVVAECGWRAAASGSRAGVAAAAAAAAAVGAGQPDGCDGRLLAPVAARWLPAGSDGAAAAHLASCVEAFAGRVARDAAARSAAAGRGDAAGASHVAEALDAAGHQCC